MPPAPAIPAPEHTPLDQAWRNIEREVVDLQRKIVAADDLRSAWIRVRRACETVCLTPLSRTDLPSSQQLGSRMRRVRLARGISQRVLAAHIGTIQTHISLIELGRQDYPSISMINRIGKALEMKASTLMGFEDFSAPREFASRESLKTVQSALFAIGLSERLSDDVARIVHDLWSVRTRIERLSKRRVSIPEKRVIGRNIRRERMRKGMSLAAVGELCGRTGSAVSDLEFGNNEAILPIYEAIARALHVTLPDLLGFTDLYPDTCDVSLDQVLSQQHERKAPSRKGE
jgi:transcriptional regulator with XRE-family HTH domain